MCGWKGKAEIRDQNPAPFFDDSIHTYKEIKPHSSAIKANSWWLQCCKIISKKARTDRTSSGPRLVFLEADITSTQSDRKTQGEEAHPDWTAACRNVLLGRRSDAAFFTPRSF